jgi:hypothetical protein
MKVPAAGEDRKFVVLGALDDASGQLIHQTRATKDGAAFAACLDHWAAQLPDDGLPTIVVLDTVSYHQSHELHALWQRLCTRLRPLWLPAYAPQLNLIERVWRYLKDKVGCHRWWNDLDRLMRATDTLLDHLTVHFHADARPAFRLVQDLHNLLRDVLNAPRFIRALGKQRVVVGGLLLPQSTCKPAASHYARM